jgi:type VI secretion system secreted protein VgrG
VHHRASESYRPGAPGAVSYENEFECIDATVQLRPSRRTRKPVIYSVQTAEVVGPSSEEIFVDNYGRVKVQFHWDREGHRNENSSCWIRVSQGWAGKNWGMVHLPRVGQEVVVAFLEGDPDQPIVVGRVYNGENMPPYDLPANKTQSGVKSRSTPGGSPDNFNEIRFEDKKGKEQLYIHAERTLTTVVEGSESHSVGGSRSTAVGQDETLVVKKGNRTTTLEEGNDSLTITKGNRDTDISQGNDTLFVAQGNIEIGAPAGAYHVTSKTVLIEGTEKITLSCGGSSITIEPGKISVSSPQISSVASGVHDIKGALVKVNS